MTYKAYYALEKTIDDDPELDTRRAQRKVARFAALHPTALSQKVEVMIEHFQRHVRPELEGHTSTSLLNSDFLTRWATGDWRDPLWDPSFLPSRLTPQTHLAHRRPRR